MEDDKHRVIPRAELHKRFLASPNMILRMLEIVGNCVRQQNPLAQKPPGGKMLEVTHRGTGHNPTSPKISGYKCVRGHMNNIIIIEGSDNKWKVVNWPRQLRTNSDQNFE